MSHNAVTTGQKRVLKDLFFQPTNTWQRRVDFQLDHVIRMQSTAAPGNLTAVHFWRYLVDESDVHETYRESPIEVRKYAEPVTALFQVMHTVPKKPLKKTVVDNEISQTIDIDLAECIRLGELFGTEDEGLDFHFYLPKASDVFQWNGSLFEISEVSASRYYKLLQRFIVWQGAAELLRTDSTDPTVPITVLAEKPELVHPLWLK